MMTFRFVRRRALQMLLPCVGLLAGAPCSAWAQEHRRQDLRAQDLRGNVRLHEALEDLELRGRWYYGDLEGARAEARKTGKPLFVLLRCPP